MASVGSIDVIPVNPNSGNQPPAGLGGPPQDVDGPADLLYVTPAEAGNAAGDGAPVGPPEGATEIGTLDGYSDAVVYEHEGEYYVMFNNAEGGAVTLNAEDLARVEQDARNGDEGAAAYLESLGAGDDELSSYGVEDPDDGMTDTTTVGGTDDTADGADDLDGDGSEVTNNASATSMDEEEESVDDVGDDPEVSEEEEAEVDSGTDTTGDDIPGMSGRQTTYVNDNEVLMVRFHDDQGNVIDEWAAQSVNGLWAGASSGSEGSINRLKALGVDDFENGGSIDIPKPEDTPAVPEGTVPADEDSRFWGTQTNETRDGRDVIVFRDAETGEELGVLTETEARTLLSAAKDGESYAISELEELGVEGTTEQNIGRFQEGAVPVDATSGTEATGEENRGLPGDYTADGRHVDDTTIGGGNLTPDETIEPGAASDRRGDSFVGSTITQDNGGTNTISTDDTYTVTYTRAFDTKEEADHFSSGPRGELAQSHGDWSSTSPEWDEGSGRWIVTETISGIDYEPVTDTSGMSVESHVPGQQIGMMIVEEAQSAVNPGSDTTKPLGYEGAEYTTTSDARANTDANDSEGPWLRPPASSPEPEDMPSDGEMDRLISSETHWNIGSGQYDSTMILQFDTEEQANWVAQSSSDPNAMVRRNSTTGMFDVMITTSGDTSSEAVAGNSSLLDQFGWGSSQYDATMDRERAALAPQEDSSIETAVFGEGGGSY